MKRMWNKLLALFISVLLFGMSNPILATLNVYAFDGSIPPGGNIIEYGGGFIPGEVLASADSLEQAEAIAAVYGLDLKSYACGIAVLVSPNPKLSVMQSQAMLFSSLPELCLNRLCAYPIT